MSIRERSPMHDDLEDSDSLPGDVTEAHVAPVILTVEATSTAIRRRRMAVSALVVMLVAVGVVAASRRVQPETTAEPAPPATAPRATTTPAVAEPVEPTATNEVSVFEPPVLVADRVTLDSSGGAISVLDNDAAVEGAVQLVAGPTSGSVDISGAEAVYTPAEGFVGLDSFDYQVCNGTACERATVDVTVLPAETSRFVDIPTARLLDTRETGTPVDAGGSVDVDVAFHVPAHASAVAVSVNVAMAQGPGAIDVSAGGAAVTAIDVGGPGQMTTNIVFVPRLAESPLSVVTAGGGHLVVDVVGYFEPSGATASGRFVPLAPGLLRQLVTETEGREAVVPTAGVAGVPADGVASVVVRVRADVGSDGGRVRLGSSLDDLSNTMMWAPTETDDRTRQGVAIVPVDEIGQLAFDYGGGAVLDLDVLGYFTDAQAEVSRAGLYVADPLEAVVDTAVVADAPLSAPVAELLGLPPTFVSAVAITAVGVSPDRGGLVVGDAGATASIVAPLGGGAARGGSTITVLDDTGVLAVISAVDAAVRIDVAGYFLGDL